MATAKPNGRSKEVRPTRATPTRDAIRETYAAQRREAVAALHAAGLGGRAAELEPLIRDTIAVTVLPPLKTSPRPGVSRLGGSPELPPGSPWPEVNGEPLPFLAQLRLEEVAPYDIHDRLPTKGLLSMFVGRVLDANGVPVTHARVLHVPTRSDLVPLQAATAPSKPSLVELAPLAMLPPYGSRLVKYNRAYQDFYDERYDMGSGTPRHGLLCFDRPLEELLGPDEEILLRLDQARAVPYDFVEAAVVYVLMPRVALAGRDFSAARAVEGATI